MLLGPQDINFVQEFMASVVKFEDLYKYEEKFALTCFDRLLKCIKLLPDYRRYRDYLGANISQQRSTFSNEFLKKIFAKKQSSLANVQKVQRILKILQNDPLYNFMDDDLLEDS